MSAASNAASRAAGGQWFRRDPRRRAGDLAVVCLPHAGGGASAFRSWGALLPERVDVLAVQYPGHEGRWREPLCHDVGELAAALTDALERSVTTEIVLFGHSFGALVAFEMALTLRRQGRRQPRHLFVSGSRAPDTRPLRAPIHGAPDAALLQYVAELGGLPDELLGQPSLVEMLLPIIRADLRMDETYLSAATPPIASGITAFVGVHDADLTIELADGWRRHTSGGFRLTTLGAGHFWPPQCEAEALGIVGATVRDLLADGPRPATCSTSSA